MPASKEQIPGEARAYVRQATAQRRGPSIERPLHQAPHIGRMLREKTFETPQEQLIHQAVDTLLAGTFVPPPSDTQRFISIAIDRDGLSPQNNKKITDIIVTTSVAAMMQPREVIEEVAATFDKSDRTSDLLRQHDAHERAASSNIQLLHVETEENMRRKSNKETTTHDAPEASNTPDDILRRKIAERAVNEQLKTLFHTLNGTGPGEKMHEGLLHSAKELTTHLMQEMREEIRHEELLHNQETLAANEGFIPSIAADTNAPFPAVRQYVPKGERTEVVDGRVEYTDTPAVVVYRRKDPKGA